MCGLANLQDDFSMAHGAAVARAETGDAFALTHVPKRFCNSLQTLPALASAASLVKLAASYGLVYGTS